MNVCRASSGISHANRALFFFFKHDVWILRHKNPDRILNKTFSTWGTTMAARVSAATASLWPQPKQQALILLNNPADCTPTRRKPTELRRLACPPCHPDDPDRGPTTCGTNSWAANKPYFTPAPHQPDHFYLWFFTRSERRWLAPNLQSRKMQTGRLKGAGFFFSDRTSLAVIHGYRSWFCLVSRWTLSDGCPLSFLLFHLCSSRPPLLEVGNGGCFPFWSVAKCIFQVFYLARSGTRGCLTLMVLITVQPPWQLLHVRTSQWPLTPHYPKFILLKHHNEGFTGPIAGFI